MATQDIPMDSLLKKIGSIYKLCIIASRRTIELSEGGQKLVESKPDLKPSQIALKEIAEGRISYKVHPAPSKHS